MVRIRKPYTCADKRARTRPIYEVLDRDGKVVCKIFIEVIPEEDIEVRVIAEVHGGVSLRKTKGLYGSPDRDP